MPWLSEDVAMEVEALLATYGDELLQVDEAAHALRMPLLAPAAHEGEQHFVQCGLQLTLPRGYLTPEQAPPAVSLQDVHGFAGRQAALARELAAAAADAAGEMVLGLLFETAKAWLTDNNCPEGPCIFCLEALEQQQDQQQQQQAALLRLPCFHAFHRSCFAGWWCWQQAALEQQQAALEAKTGATAAAALVQEALPPRDGLHFQLACPSCRATFSLQDLQQGMRELLVQQLAKQGQGGGQEQDAAVACARKLTALQLQPFKELQRRHAALFARQQQRQGIIVDASYSISDWEQPPPPPQQQQQQGGAALGDERGCQGDGARRPQQGGGRSRGGGRGGDGGGGGRGRGGGSRHGQQRQ